MCAPPTREVVLMHIHPIDWEKAVAEYEAIVRNLSAIQDLSREYNKGNITSTPLTIRGYLDFLNFFWNHGLLRDLSAPVRILDVGCFLNMFADFIHVNADTIEKYGVRVACAGLESNILYCRLARDLFPEAELIRGDIRNATELTDHTFDIVVLNNFFHQYLDFSRRDIADTFAAIHAILRPGGYIFYKYANSQQPQPEYAAVYDKHGGCHRVADLVPENYLCPDQCYAQYWYLTRKLP